MQLHGYQKKGKLSAFLATFMTNPSLVQHWMAVPNQLPLPWTFDAHSDGPVVPCA